MINICNRFLNNLKFDSDWNEDDKIKYICEECLYFIDINPRTTANDASQDAMDIRFEILNDSNAETFNGILLK